MDKAYIPRNGGITPTSRNLFQILILILWWSDLKITELEFVELLSL